MYITRNTNAKKRDFVPLMKKSSYLEKIQKEAAQHSKWINLYTPKINIVLLIMNVSYKTI